MSANANQLVEHFFRHESANLVAVLTRAFGVRRLDLVEDMVQVAMLEAMHAWKQRGVPDNPSAWIHRATKNRILDALRREQIHEKAIALSGQTVVDEASVLDDWLDEQRVPDSLLRMMFACCHPSLKRKTQIALTLKVLCGFSNDEIARGLLLSKETVKKRIQRAKKSLVDVNAQLEFPSDPDVAERLNVVHDVLYLMFNEGYSTSHGIEPIRDDICEESARLCHLLCESAFGSAATRALLALMLFHAARLDARTDNHGGTILLEDQDRGKWDRRLIGIGQSWLAKSKTERPTTFHLEAAIAMQHCVAASVDDTDWEHIVQLYDRLLQLRTSPIYSLNRAIALGQAGNISSSLEALHQLQASGELNDYYLLECAIARIHELDGNKKQAIDAYLAAMTKDIAEHERVLLERKLRGLT